MNKLVMNRLQSYRELIILVNYLTEYPQAIDTEPVKPFRQNWPKRVEHTEEEQAL